VPPEACGDRPGTVEAQVGAADTGLSVGDVLEQCAGQPYREQVDVGEVEVLSVFRG
jgi:hypothetical protein